MLSKEDNQLLTQTGPGTPMGELFRRFWMPALISDELPQPDCPPLRLKLLGEDLVAFRDSTSRVGVLDAYCAHRRSRLYYGRNEESGLRCIYHGWKFDVAGSCVDMPTEPVESGFKDRIHIKSYPAREWGGVIWIYMGPPELMPQLPLFEWCQVPPSHRTVTRWMQECNYCQGMEGEMDSTHASFLHQWFDATQLPSGPAGARGGTAKGGRPTFELNGLQDPPRQTDFGMIRFSHTPEPGGLIHWRFARFMIPNFSLVSSPSYPVGGRCFVPIDDEHCTVFQYMSHPERPLAEDERRRLGPNSPDQKKYTPDIEAAVYQLPSGYAIDTWRDKRTLQNDYLQDREFQRTRNMSGIPAQRTQDTAMVERQGASSPDRGVCAILSLVGNIVRTTVQSRCYDGSRHGHRTAHKHDRRPPTGDWCDRLHASQKYNTLSWQGKTCGITNVNGDPLHQLLRRWSWLLIRGPLGRSM